MSTQTDVAELYTAFFNRAPDAGGLAYWVDQLGSGVITLNQIAQNWMESQPEAQIYYPTGQTTAIFIQQIYTNVLNRTADTAGLDYWTTQLNSGAVDRETFVAAVINGAKANTSDQGLLDAALISNKAAVGVSFADQGMNDLGLASKVLTTITADSNSLAAAQSLIALVPVNADSTTLDAYNAALTKIATLISTTAPADLAATLTNLATYVASASADKSVTTDLSSLISSVGDVAANPTALADPAKAASDSLNASTPFILSEAGGVLTIGGTSTDAVTIDLDAHTVLRAGIDQGVTASFASVDVSGYASPTVTAKGSIEAFQANPALTGVDFKAIVDTAANLLETGATAVAAIGATSVAVSGEAAGPLSFEDLTSLTSITTDHTFSYSIADTFANITSTDNAAALANHTYALTDNDGLSLGGITVVGATAVLGATNGADYSYSIVDTPTNLVAASSEIIDGASDVQVLNGDAGVLTVEQFGLLTTITNGNTFAYSIADSLVNLQADGSAAVLADHDYSFTDTAVNLGEFTVATSALVTGATNHASYTYNLTDSASNLLDAGVDSDAVQFANVIAVTGNDAGAQSFFSITSLKTIVSAGNSSFNYTVADTLANIQDSDNAAALTGHDYAFTDLNGSNLGTFTVTGAAVVNLATNGTDYDYTLTDSADALLAATITSTAVANAAEVTVAGEVAGPLSFANLVLLNAITSDHTFTYSIVDTLANIQNPDNADALLNHTYSLTDLTVNLGTFDVASVVVVNDAANGTSYTYTLVDSAANLLAATVASAAVTGANVVTVIGNAAGPLSFAQVTLLKAITTDAGDNFTYSIADTLANIQSPANAAALLGHTHSFTDVATNLGTFSVTGAAVVNTATNGTSYGYTLTDTSTNLLTATITSAAVHNATAVTVTGEAAGALSFANLSLLNAITTDHSFTYSIADTLADIQSPLNSAALIGHNYAFTDVGVNLGTFDVSSVAVVNNATNHGSYTYTLVDSAT
ncbi:DUF4214 domain-containing protein, partial [Pseudomonas sp.]|uniref:DUF4214 domain-containing protein n=1 Tax=Pseudomonas sp. TaxID=306 RepID=UPI0026083B1F